MFVSTYRAFILFNVIFASLHCNRDLPLISIFHPKKIKGFLTLIKKSMIAEKN